MNNNITKISLGRIDDHVNFIASNENGNSILMDGSPSIGGKGNGVRPMETLLMGAAGCSTIDIVLIMKKMKQEIKDIKVEVEAERVKVEDHTIYKTIHMHYKVWGDIKEDKLTKAINLSVQKYCSVSKILEKSASIKTSYTLNPEST